MSSETPAPDAVPATNFGELFDDVFPHLAGYCASLLGDADRGADLAQEALVRTWGRWVAVRHPRAHAYRVATNLVRREWRHRARDREMEGRADWIKERQVGAGDNDLWVWDLVERLPARLREPTLLHYYAGIDQREVAAVLHLPDGSVRQRLSQARQLLKKMIEDEP